jgi:uncharacterized protein (DUF2236 family)
MRDWPTSFTSRAARTVPDPRTPVRWLHEHYIIGPQSIVDASRDPGDVGWVGPDSVSWRLFADPSSVLGVFVAMMMQAGNPVVADAFQSFSDYQLNPKKRFWLTGGFYFTVTYGSSAEVEEWVSRARRGHRGIVGRGVDGVAQPIAHPEIIRFSHLTVIDATLRAWDAFGPENSVLSETDRDRFCEEQAWAAMALGARDVPFTYSDLRIALAQAETQPRWSPAGLAAFRSILKGDGLSPATRAIYRVLVDGARAALPVEHRVVWPGGKDEEVSVDRGKMMAAGARLLLPPLSCEYSARQRIDSPCSPNTEYGHPPRLSSAFLRSGRLVLDKARTTGEHASLSEDLGKWWCNMLMGSPTENESFDFLGGKNLHYLGVTDNSGRVTRTGFYAAAALRLKRVGPDEVARESRLVARRLAN